MLSLPVRSRSDIRPLRHWKMLTVAEAAGLVGSGTTVAVGWLGDDLAVALADGFAARAQPNDLTIIYATTRGEGRGHGLNRLAQEGLVRRVVGGQWHPVPAFQMLAAAGRIEARSLPAGVINRLFRDVAEGLPRDISRAGSPAFTDPRDGAGRLNQRPRDQPMRPFCPPGNEIAVFGSFPIDVALIGVAFMAGTAAITTTRESMTIARAARKSGGIVIAQMERIGTLDKLPPGHAVMPDTLVDVLVEADTHQRRRATFSSVPGPRAQQRQRTV